MSRTIGSGKDELEVLYAAIAIEEFGIEFYHRLEKCVAEEGGKALMRGLARDEAHHRQVILDEVRRITGGKVEQRRVDLTGYGIEPSKVFMSLPTDRCLTIKEEMEVLKVGMEVERRSIDMYASAAKDSIDEEVRGRLLQLVDIERGHLRLLEENEHMLRMEGSWYGYTPILEG
ncbi:MAG: ferritin family protein [Methanomassiliicoccales archaeon]|nr:MAG: ferritin family protein [Methanomassiliicoccales archaeon]